MKVSLFALILGAHIHAAMAFTSQSILLNPTVYSPTSSSSSSSLQAGIGDDFLDFFKNIWGTNNDNNSNKKKMNNENDNDLSSLSDEVAGSTLITSIPGTQGLAGNMIFFHSRLHLTNLLQIRNVFSPLCNIML